MKNQMYAGIHAYNVDAFAKEVGKGNRAGVVLNAAKLSLSEMQKIAQRLGHSETAFVLPAQEEGLSQRETNQRHDLAIRYFTPTTEVPLCGHATIASHYVRAVAYAMQSQTLLQKSAAGIIRIDIASIARDYTITMHQPSPTFDHRVGAEVERLLFKALGITVEDRDSRCPLEIVSTGHAKLLIGIRSLEKLHTLEPHREQLTALSRMIGCNGFFVFVLHPEHPNYLTSGRMFAPAIGIVEDPVTGNANGPLGAYIAYHRLVPFADNHLQYTAFQGKYGSRTGSMQVSVRCNNAEPTQVRITGNAVIVNKVDLHTLLEREDRL